MRMHGQARVRRVDHRRGIKHECRIEFAREASSDVAWQGVRKNARHAPRARDTEDRAPKITSARQRNADARPNFGALFNKRANLLRSLCDAAPTMRRSIRLNDRHRPRTIDAVHRE